MKAFPKQSDLSGQKQFRIIPSHYPRIDFFEELVDPTELEMLWEIESLTNERLLQEAGNLFLVAPEDRISGPGSSIVMGAFTHIGKASRFTDGSFGVYYASLNFETAVRETVFHRQVFLAATNESPCEITMRAYEGIILKELHDIRDPTYEEFHHPESYITSQALAETLRTAKSWGLIYNSVRDVGNACIAAFRPPAISIPLQSNHLRYLWNGKKIAKVFDTKLLLSF